MVLESVDEQTRTPPARLNRQASRDSLGCFSLQREDVRRHQYSAKDAAMRWRSRVDSPSGTFHMLLPCLAFVAESVLSEPVISSRQLGICCLCVSTPRLWQEQCLDTKSVAGNAS